MRVRQFFIEFHFFIFGDHDFLKALWMYLRQGFGTRMYAQGSNSVS